MIKVKLGRKWLGEISSCQLTRVADAEVKYPTPTPTFQNFRLRFLNVKGMKFDC